MARNFFGTDGIRGRTNEGVMTAATAMRVGQAAGTHFLRGDHRHRVVGSLRCGLGSLRCGLGRLRCGLL